MKPHRLRLAGIGPYPSLVEIDFDELGALGLYLIVGPTGAGKTTIFDAITYALYGKVAGERPDTGIVSDHAHRAAPFIELDFSHRGRSYRVYRRPPVDNKAVKTNDVRFTEFAGGDFHDEVRVQTGTTAVTKAISELIGLDAHQFMRVMLLPQNEFQKFLLASSKDKEPLLRALFGTRTFEQIADEIAESAKRLRRESEAKQDELEQRRYAIRQLVEGLEERGLMTDLPDPDHDLQTVLAVVAKASSAAAQLHERASAAAKKALDAFAKGEREAERFDAAKELAELVERAREANSSLTAAREALERHQRAERVAADLGARDDLAGRVAELTASVGEARIAVTGELAADDLAPCLLPLRTVASTADARALSTELVAIEALVQGASAGHAAASKAALDSEQHAAAAAGYLSDAEAATALIVELVPQLETARREHALATSLTKEHGSLGAQVDALDRQLLAADLVGPQSALVKAERALTSATKKLGKASGDLAAARSTHTRHLAGELAAELVDGAECPVCGSCEHPNPAQSTVDLDVPTLERARDTAQATFTKAEGAWEMARAAVESAQVAAAQLPSLEDQQSLRTRHASAVAAVESLDELAAVVSDLTDRLAEAQSTETTSTVQATNAANASAELMATSAQLRAAANEVLVEERLVEVVATIGRLKSALGELELASTALATETTKHEVATRRVLTTMEREGFIDEGKVLAAVLEVETLESMGELVEEARCRDLEITRLTGVVGKKPVPAERPDVEALEEVANAADATATTALARANSLENGFDDLQKQADSLAELGPDAQQLVERARRAKALADVILRGAGITLGLERWVQRALFEEVCVVASEQIRVLSHGRYVLTLDASGQPQRARAAGLDLYVTDSHTGKTRTVQSLSGGEQFLTSLALALALAEVVQNRSGGIELSTLFIDEGFGSLDGDTLDSAVEVLRSLQDTGRTVGLISHVEAMRQELTVGIQVIPTAAGSTLRTTSLAA